MDTAAELERNPVSQHQISTRFSLSMEMSRLTRDGTVEPVSRDQILRRERGQGNNNFPCSADHVQDYNLHVVHTLAICVDKLCDTYQGGVPTNIKTADQTSVFVDVPLIFSCRADHVPD